MKKKVLIVGGGISGLSAGIYAAMNGFEVHVFEKSPHPGGVCQSWNRSGYSVNGSVHWLMGSGPGTEYYTMWRELGLIENMAYYYHSRFFSYENPDGRILHFFTDVQRLRVELKRYAPEDEDAIEEFCSTIETLARHPIPFPQNSLWDKSRQVLKTTFADFPLIREMVHWYPVTLGEFAGRFSHPDLRDAFRSFWHPEMSMIFLLAQFAFAHMGAAGYPLGGSGALIQRLVTRFVELSGHLHLSMPVAKIRIEAGMAREIVLENGSILAGDYVVGAADGYQTLFSLVDPPYRDPAFQEAVEQWKPFPGILYFSAGFRYDFPTVEPSIMGVSLPLAHPIVQPGEEIRRVTFQPYRFDPTLAGPGQTLVTAMIPSSYEAWKALRDQGEENYRNERRRIAQELVQNLEIRFPGLRGTVEFSDLATPLTYEKETGNYRGSYEGWLPTPESMRRNLPSAWEGVSNFFLCGHWMSAGGGMPPAAFTGRNAVYRICEKEGLEFCHFTS